MREFIHRIQNSDEQTKRFWLVVFSAATMFVVVGLWVAYTNITLPVATIPDMPDQQQVAAAPKAATPGFFSIFAAGLNIIYSKVQELISNKVAEKNDIVIDNPDHNFVLEGLPAVPSTKLNSPR